MSLSSDLLPGVPLIESPLFGASLDELDLTEEERRVAHDLHDRGYAVMDFPDPDIESRADRIKQAVAERLSIELENPDVVRGAGDLRIQDGWKFDRDIRAVATNEAVLALLERLYGRPAFPFQTLNFPVGTQQHLHSDAIHFSSVPERFMCGVWLALEDVQAGSGALTYIPGSHKWPIVTNTMIGRKGYGARTSSAQAPFEAAWAAMVAASPQQPESFLARKGQALIWTANLLHGGSPRTDPSLTRWSQVTHYYFDDCVYYTPAFSGEGFDRLDLRAVVDACTDEIRPNQRFGERIEVRPASRASLISRAIGRVNRTERKAGDLPEGFDPYTYYQLNPDVARAGEDAGDHYRKHGASEGRQYKA